MYVIIAMSGYDTELTAYTEAAFTQPMRDGAGRKKRHFSMISKVL